MKKITNLAAIALVAVTLLFGKQVSAQTTPAPSTSTNSSPWRLGIGLESGLGTGSENSRGPFELGGTARLQYNVSNGFAITLTSGYYNFFGKAKDHVDSDAKFPNLQVIPLEAGVKAFLSSNIYFGAEAGAAFVENNSNTKLMLSPALGYANRSWDVSVRYDNFSGGNSVGGVVYDYGLLGVRVAYSFGL